MEERRDIREELKVAGEVTGEVARKIATGLETVARKITVTDVPKLVRNVFMLATSGMTLYLMFSAVSTMAPYAVQVYAQFGRVLGFMIPLMFMMTVLSIMIAIMKHVVK
jgi:hypothetical protein